MINQQPRCDDQLLLRMLRHRSDSHDSAEMLDHVEACERCQHRLDELAAEETEWQKTIEILSATARGDALNEMDGFDSSRDIPDIHLRQPAWTESVAVMSSD